MRLGAVAGVLAVLVSGCSSAGDDPHGRYPSVDACRLVRDQTVETLSAGLPKMPQESTGGANSLPYDLSICPFQFGTMPATGSAMSGQPPTGIPAYRAFTITAYRYNANSTQSAAHRAQILFDSLRSAKDPITSPSRNLDQVYLRTFDDAQLTKAEVWALAGNVVLDIVYEVADTDGFPSAVTTDEGRDGALALIGDAAGRLSAQ